jgi:ubiquinol-cytochrome c reductase cytochrome b subunit
VGPDLSNVVAKDRTKEALIAFIKDPQAVRSWSIMPKYDLAPNELNSLADFILALDFKRNGVKTVRKTDVVGPSP